MVPGPVRRPISADVRWNFNPGFFFYWKTFSGVILSVLLRSSNHHIVGKMNLLFNLSNLHSNFALTLGYLNRALNNWLLNYPFTPAAFGTCWTTYRWFAVTWWDGHVGGQNNSKLWLVFCIIIESNSQKTFSLLFCTPTWPRWRQVKTIYCRYFFVGKKILSFFSRRPSTNQQ